MEAPVSGVGAETGTKNMTQNRGPKRRASSNNGYNKEENDSNSDELLQLQWSNHSNAFGAAMSKLRSNETFCDVTLVSAKGEQFSAHKVVISACSTHLQSMLKPLPGWQHPVLIMPKDIPTEDLRDILAFMYSGEVSKYFSTQAKKIWLLNLDQNNTNKLNLKGQGNLYTISIPEIS